MIRTLEQRDVEACVEIVRRNWNDEVAERFRTEVAHAFTSKDEVSPYAMEWPPRYYVWESDGDETTRPEILGFAGMIASWVMHGVWDFIWINVREDSHGRGIGRALTDYRLHQVELLGGSVINLMTQKHGFFKRHGFRVVHVYDGGWVSMTKQLKKLEL